MSYEASEGLCANFAHSVEMDVLKSCYAKFEAYVSTENVEYCCELLKNNDYGVTDGVRSQVAALANAAIEVCWTMKDYGMMMKAEQYLSLVYGTETNAVRMRCQPCYASEGASQEDTPMPGPGEAKRVLKDVDVLAGPVSAQDGSKADERLMDTETKTLNDLNDTDLTLEITESTRTFEQKSAMSLVK